MCKVINLIAIKTPLTVQYSIINSVVKKWLSRARWRNLKRNPTTPTLMLMCVYVEGGGRTSGSQVLSEKLQKAREWMREMKWTISIERGAANCCNYRHGHRAPEVSLTRFRRLCYVSGFRKALLVSRSLLRVEYQVAIVWSRESLYPVSARES